QHQPPLPDDGRGHERQVPPPPHGDGLIPMLFGAINTAGSGLTVYRTWLDAVSDNIANMNDAVPGDQPSFQERFVYAAAKADASGRAICAGVAVTGILLGNTQGRITL